MSEKIIRNLLRALRGEISPGAIQNVMKEAERAMEAKIVTFPSPDPKRERTAAKARVHTTIRVHEAGDLPIYAHGGMFYAFVGPEEEGRGVEADTLQGCKDRAIAAWRLYSPVVWRRAIHVMFERTRPAQYTPSDQTAGISITACRYWHGTRFDGTVRTVPMRDWSLSQPVEVREHARFLGVPLPTVDNRWGAHRVDVDIPYDDATWATIEEILRLTRQLGDRLDELFKAPEMLALAGHTALLLGRD